LTATGRGFNVTLASDQRGNVETREAKTRLEAYKAARGLLALAEFRTWYTGEAVLVRIEQQETP